MNSQLPITHWVGTAAHSRTVSALGIDPNGSRFVSGSYDNSIKYWDFYGMDSDLIPFRHHDEPCGAHVIRKIQFNSRGDRLLVVPNSAQAKVFDRDGHEMVEFIRGDGYLLDMKNTAGHVSIINSGDWNPVDNGRVVTCSDDGTIRIWDLGNHKKHHSIIISKARGRRVPVSTIRYSSDGRVLYSGHKDGSLRIWDGRGSCSYPVNQVENAHAESITCTDISEKNRLILSRSLDATMKVWDSRKLDSSLCVVHDLENEYDETMCMFSPDETLMVTGTSSKTSRQSMASLHIYRIQDFERICQLETDSGIISMCWNSTIHQILLGKINGTIQIFYDPTMSTKGICMAISKPAQPRRVADPGLIPSPIVPLFGNDELEFADPTKHTQEPQLYQPELPFHGPGRGGKQGTNMAQHLMKRIVLDRSKTGSSPR